MFTFENRENTESVIRNIIESEYNIEPEIIENEDSIILSIDFICFHIDYSEKVAAIISDKWGYSVDIKMLSNRNQSIAYFKIVYDLFSKAPVPHSYDLQKELLINFIPIVTAKKKGHDEFVYINSICKFRKKIISKDSYRNDLNFAPRSSWEANIARVLKYLGIPFEHEKNSFIRYEKNSREIVGCYVPDYFLPDDTLLEVKGFWDASSRNKVYEFIINYTAPNNLDSDFHENGAIYKLYIIDHDIYSMLSKMYRNLIVEWEEDELHSSHSDIMQIIGLSYGIRRLTYASLSIGQTVILKRDKGNTFDKNAILAYTEDMREIGFISADWACIYAPKIDIGMIYEAQIVSIEQKVVNIRVKRVNDDKIIVYDFLMMK